MTVTYSLTRSDIFLGSMLREYRRLSTFFLSLIPGAAYAAYIAPEGYARFSPGVVAAVLLAVCLGITAFIWPATILIGAVFTSRQAGLDRGVLCEHTLALEPEGIRETSAFDQSVRAWNSLLSVQSSWLGVILVMAGGTYYFVPRRAFVSRLAQDEFASAARAASIAGALTS